MHLLNGNIGIFFPWADGIGTLGIKLGRFYCDIYWMNWPRPNLDDQDNVAGWDYRWSDLIPSGIYTRLPWFKAGDRIIGGGQYRLWFKRFWRGFRRQGA